MNRNYLTLAVRNLLRNKGTSLIHMVGLALGLAAFLLIQSYTSFEKSYDLFHQKANRIVRLTTDNVINGEVQVRDAMSFSPSGPALAQEYPEIESYTTTYKFSPTTVRVQDQLFEEAGLLAVDSNFLKIFDYQLIDQNNSLFTEPYTMAISEELALKYFGTRDVVGRNLEILSRFDEPFKIVGVLKSIPANTHYSFDGLISLPSINEQLQRDAWSGYNYYTYLLLHSQTNLSELHDRLAPVLREKYLKNESTLQFNLQPITDIHLHSDLTYEPEIHGSAQAVKYLNLISIFILIIAWINYINLTTAKSLDRAKEVGIRKVVGAKKVQLIRQFLTESIVINLISAVFAIIMVQLALPYFNQFAGKTIMEFAITDQLFLLQLTVFFFIGIFATGFYPALVLSSFKPKQIIQGKLVTSYGGHIIRRTLVVLQFALSVILIANTIIVYQQVRYMLNKDLGIDISKVIGVKNPIQIVRDNQSSTRYAGFLTELERQTGVLQAASISNLPGGGSSDISSNSGGIRIVGKTERNDGVVYINQIDDEIKDVLGISILYGRNFDRNRPTDTMSVIVNEAFLTMLDIEPSEALVNEQIQFGRDPQNDKYSIIGVIQNFNRSSLKNHVEPTVFFYEDVAAATVIRIDDNAVQGAIQQIQSVWQDFFPDVPFSYAFLDQRFEKLYLEDQRFGKLFAGFSILAIVIATLGLFGLSSFLANKRRKEIGIRKVLGASITQIVISFFKEYLALIVLAFVVAVPVIFFSMNAWLANYAFRIQFPFWAPLLSLLCMAFFAFLTVGIQNLRVARMNPAEAIREE